jgi:hypothetical protein
MRYSTAICRSGGRLEDRRGGARRTGRRTCNLPTRSTMVDSTVPAKPPDATRAEPDRSIFVGGLRNTPQAHHARRQPPERFLRQWSPAVRRRQNRTGRPEHGRSGSQAEGQPLRPDRDEAGRKQCAASVSADVGPVRGSALYDRHGVHPPSGGAGGRQIALQPSSGQPEEPQAAPRLRRPPDAPALDVAAEEGGTARGVAVEAHHELARDPHAGVVADHLRGGRDPHRCADKACREAERRNDQRREPTQMGTVRPQAM